MTYYVGVDLHSKNFSYYAADQGGQLFCKGKLPTTQSAVEEFVGLFQTKPHVVVEATRNWMWFVASLKDQGCSVILAHPFRVKAIAAARIKTDAVDAKTLCDLLRANLIPQSYVSSTIEQEAREISRMRCSLVHDRTLVKNRIHALLGKENYLFDGTDMFGTKGQAWMDTLPLSPAKQAVLSVYRSQLKGIEGAIEKAEELIKQKRSELPQVRLLESIPGIGTVTAFLLASEIGDVKRFPSSKQFASYFGLVPRLSQSGNHAYYGRITKLGNPYVRWSLVQSAHRYVRINGEAQRFVRRLTVRCGKKKAIVALARKLSAIVYCVLIEERMYKPESPKEVRPAIIPDKQ